MNIGEAKRIINIGLGKEKNLYTTSDNVLKASKIILNELEKKDKVINMMAECIDGEPTFGYGHLRDINTPEKVKEYFYKLVEGNIDKKQTK